MRYRISLGLYGGEYTLGTTTKEIKEFWDDFERHELEEHIFADGVFDIPPQYSLYPYYDQTDLIHIHGVELTEHNYLEITNEENGQTELDISLKSFFIRDLMEVIPPPFEELEVGQPVIYCISEEKGNWDYELEIDEPIDPKKLRFHLYDLEGTFVIANVEYDGMDLEIFDASSVGKSFSASFGEIYDDKKDQMSLPFDDKRMINTL